MSHDPSPTAGAPGTPAARPPTHPPESDVERLARIVAQLPVAVAVYEGRAHVFRAVSAAYREIVGGRDVIGVPIREALPELDARFFELLDRVYATGQEVAGRSVPARWDGDGDGVPEDRAVDFTYRPLLGPDGAVEGVVALVSDVTARVRAEEALRRSEERYERAARAAEHERADLEAVLEVVPIGIGIARDPECRDIRVNPAFAAQLGIAPGTNASKSADEAGALPFRVLDPARGGAEVPPDELPMQCAAREGIRIDGRELDIEHADGRVVRLLEYAVPLRADDGRVRGAVGAFVDVTARARLEAAERAAREAAEAATHRLALLAEAGAALAASLDPVQTMRAVSRVALPALGDWCLVDLLDSVWHPARPDAAGGAVAGRPVECDVLRRAYVGHTDPARSAEATEAAHRHVRRAAWPEAHPIVQALRTGEPQRVQPVDAGLRARLAEDADDLAAARARATTALLCVPLVARGRRLGVLTFSTVEPAAGGTGRRFTDADVPLAVELARRAATALDNARLYQEAERVRREAELARQAAEAASRAKSDFLAVMSHELRTPLNAVLGHQELLAMGLHGPVTPAQAAALERIRRGGTRLLALITDVLNYARLEAVRAEPDAAAAPLAPVPLAEALAEVEGYVAPQLAAKGIAYALAAPDPALRVVADRGRLQQVLLNLVTNAVKFTPAGGRIDVAAEAAPDVVRVRVRDTGIGIPPDKLETIFHPFVQVSQGRTREHEGVGLGLAISRGLARLMGGDLSVESAVGAGSTFTLTLGRAADDA